MHVDNITRSRVLDPDGAVLAVLPTWSDGAIVALRPELTVEDGEWFGADCASAPEPTHRSAAEFLRGES